MHMREVDPDKDRLAGFLLSLDEVHGPTGDVVVDRHHPRLGQRTGVLANLLADLAEARIHGRVLLVRRLAIQNAARPKLGAKGWFLRIVRQLWLFLGVEVVEVAVKLVKAVNSGQVLVAVAKVVLAELSGRVAERLEQLGDRRIFLLQTQRGPG